MAMQVDALEQSFDLIAPRADELVDRFYTKLFDTAPEVKPLFERVDMARQRQSLINTLIVLRESFRDMEEVLPDLEDLGARHATWGARPEHYPVVTSCLLNTMIEIAGPDWKPEYSGAWTEALQAVQDVMIRGAEKAS